MSERTAGIIIAKVGADTEAFETVNHLASWSGLALGNNESARMVNRAGVTHGNKYLKMAMVLAAMGAKRKRKGGLQDFFYRLTSRMGNMKAVVALAHKMIRIVYAMMTEGVTYQEFKKDQRMQEYVGPTN